MNLVLFVLSVAGFLAALRRLAFAAFRLFKGSVESFVMREVASSRTDRGDVTGLLEAQALRRATRAVRARALASVVFWAALLSAPLLTRMTLPLYAFYTLLWLLPLHRQRTVT